MGILRLLLAISVVINHTDSIFGINIVGGQIAVQAFYIISGFYMSLILNEKYVGKNNSYKLFLSNRLLRLYPIYWAVALLTFGLSVLIFLKSGNTSIKIGAFGQFLRYHESFSIPTFLYLISTNIFLLGQDIVMFLGLNTHTGHLFFTSNFRLTNPQLYTFLLVPQAWTIAVEITFYLIAPFILRRNLTVICILIAISLGLRLVLINNGLSQDPWSYRFFPNELALFLLGNLSYRLYKKIEFIEINKIFSYSIITLIILISVFYEKVNFSYQIVIYIFLFFTSLPFIFKLSKQSRIDSKIGELSYPVYISHIFVLTFIVNHLNIITNRLGVGLITVICTILFSFILNKFITNPIEKIRQKRIRPILI